MFLKLPANPARDIVNDITAAQAQRTGHIVALGARSDEFSGRTDLRKEGRIEAKVSKSDDCVGVLIIGSAQPYETFVKGDGDNLCPRSGHKAECNQRANDEEFDAMTHGRFSFWQISNCHNVT